MFMYLRVYILANEVKNIHGNNTNKDILFLFYFLFPYFHDI
jgi:hypothetical protein